MSGGGTGSYTGASGIGARLTGSGSGVGTQIAPVAPADPAHDDVFGRAMRDIFDSPIAVDAVYHGVVSVPCRVIITRSVLMQPTGMEAQMWERGTTLEVLLAAVGNVEPDRGDVFILTGGETLTVRSVDQNDGYSVTLVVS